MGDSKEQFDVDAYIESAFLDTKSTKNGKKEEGGATAVVEKTDVVVTEEEESEKGSTSPRFRKTKLSAPRPRRVKEKAADAPINPELRDLWESVPRNIEFLSSFFDDSVTSNYYRGEFKETREELIKRLLDPELTLEEVSRLLGVCPATVRRYTNRGWLEHHRTSGGQRRFRLSGVVKFVEEHGRLPEE
jgi:excisionase family DNA binding protein